MGTADVSGVYEVAIGARDAAPLVGYYLQQGYRVAQQGTLDAEAADRAYGHRSALASTRLAHGGAAHGLVRVMAWAEPAGDGLGLSPLRVVGSRWTSIVTADVLNVANHVEDARTAQLPIASSGPWWDMVVPRTAPPAPFAAPAVGVREMAVLQPLTRQVFFERFHYAVPRYGAIDEACLLKTSEACHFGLVCVSDTNDVLRFYDDTLGLLRTRDNAQRTAEDSTAARGLFDLAPGEGFWVTAFDDPRSSADWQAAIPGRLYVIRFAPDRHHDDRRWAAGPGQLGMSLYTFRSRDLGVTRDRIVAGGATGVSAIAPNEFGEPSLRFTAPDGYAHGLVQRRDWAAQ